MRSPLRWLKRRIELSRQAGRRREVEEEFGKATEQSVQLVPASTKGGYDEIYLARRGAETVAVVRVNSRFKTVNDPIGPLDPGVPLGPAERLEREWEAYSRLAPEGLSPRPLWRIGDAMACEWLPWERASRVLTRNPESIWSALGRMLPAIAAMHAAGVTHLDLNLGNILLEPGGSRVAIIDFEFGPVPWVSVPQQMAFDYLRLVDDCCKPRRGGRHLLGDPARLAELLDPHPDAAAREAPMGFFPGKLQRLGEAAELQDRLEAVFPALRGAAGPA